MTQFLIIFQTYEEQCPSTFITLANNKLDDVVNLIDKDHEGYLVRLIDIGASHGMSCLIANHLRTISRKFSIISKSLMKMKSWMKNITTNSKSNTK